MKKTKEKAKKSYVFRIILLIYTVVLLIGAAVALHVIWGKLVDYQADTTAAALDGFFDRLRQSDYDAICLHSGFLSDPYNTPEQYADTIRTIFSGDLSTLRAAETVADTSASGSTTNSSRIPAVIVGKATAATTDTKYYNVYMDEERVAKVRLQKDTDGHGWNVQLLLNKTSYTVTAAAEMTVTVNGYDLAGRDLHPQEVGGEFFTGFLDPADQNIPSVLRYTVPDLLPGSTVRVTTPDGRDGVLQCTDEKNNVYMAYYPVTEAERQQYTALLKDVAEKYPLFIYQEVSRKNYLKCMYSQTVYYEGIRTFANWMYGAQDKAWFEDEEIYELYRITSHDFIGSMRYQFMLQWGRRTRNEPGDNTLTFVNIDGEWLMTHQQSHPVDEPGEIIKK